MVDNEVRQIADEAVSICEAFCAILGIQRISHPEGRVYINGHNGRAVKLTDAALVYEMELRAKPP